MNQLKIGAAAGSKEAAYQGQPQTASRRLALTQLTAPVRRLRRPSTVSRRSCEVIKEVVEEAIMNEKWNGKRSDDEEYMATGLIDRNIFRSRRGFWGSWACKLYFTFSYSAPD
jgi:hypothetical protein